VADGIGEELRRRGHDATVHRLTVEGNPHPGMSRVVFTGLPDISEYGLLAVVGPVWAFGPSPPLRSYVAQAGAFEGKKAICVVTHALPFSFTGPNRALKKIAAALAKRGAEVATGVKLHTPFTPGQDAVVRTAAQVCDRLGA
jgi:hypothetical protein